MLNIDIVARPEPGRDDHTEAGSRGQPEIMKSDISQHLIHCRYEGVTFAQIQWSINRAKTGCHCKDSLNPTCALCRD